MMFAAELARSVGRLSDADADRHRSILESLGLPITYRRDRWQALLDGMRRDKKSRGDLLRFVVLDGVGQARHPRCPGHVAAVRRLPGDCLLMNMVEGGTSEWPGSRAFPGVRINPRVPDAAEIVNEEVVRRQALAVSDGPGGPDPRPARRRASPPKPPSSSPEARYKDPGSLRLRIFEADVLRVSNRFDRAVEVFRQLLAETQGTRRRRPSASTWAGPTSPAATSAPPSNPSPGAGSARGRVRRRGLIYASTVALQRARDVLEQQS